MAQASSAQREPSMEEILASIRRIIEDSDNVRKPLDAPSGLPEQIVPAAKAEVETFRSELGPVAERRSTLAPVEPPPAVVRNLSPAQAAEPTPKTFRLAEVQAQVAREAAAAPKALDIKTPDAGGKPVTLADVQREMAKEPVARAPSAPQYSAPTPRQVEARSFAEPKAEARPFIEPKIEKPAPQPAPQPVAELRKPAEPVAVDWRRNAAPAVTDLAAPAADSVPSPASEAATRPAIISPAAGRQVAAAFGQLSEAFALRANKTFDDMAEQMLRPMLQEWLDNNLPTLVERLVREEIERVARGV